MREKRRLSLAKLQLTLARIAEREAMGSLAGALSEEERSAQLAERSRELARDFGAKTGRLSAQELKSKAGFACGLGELADQSAAARRDATDQVEWQMQTLATTRQRIEALETRVRFARQEIAAVVERREQASAGAMARKLQTHHGNPPQPTGTQNLKRTKM